ncbi:MAG: leucine-rich repeat domain-containing protein [Rikenellaceae bacterium]|nr:leucine-rich repeat domain-containing protein [Rikenellaceae bacterium]
MKKLLLLALSGLLAMGVLSSCEKDVPTKALELTAGETTQSVFADQKKALGSVSFTTAGAWTSTISGGTRAASWVAVTPSSGSKAGDYTIAITLEPNYTGSDRTAIITITCGDQTIPITVIQKAVTEAGEILVKEVTDVTLDKETLTLTEETSKTLEAIIVPEDASNKDVEWTSSDETIATVDAEGKVTAVKEGTATIIVTTADGGKTATCEVTVEPGIDLLSTEYIPDPGFLAYCKEQMTEWDINENGRLSYNEASRVNVISIDGREMQVSITSLAGIEYFPVLGWLGISFSQLTSLDISKNPALVQVSCLDNNQLTSLKVSGCPYLDDLECYNNQLTSLDVSGCPALRYLSCYDNQLTSLDVSEYAGLISLNCDRNQLTSLDVSKNTALTRLLCTGNQLTSLDVSNNTALTELYCGFPSYVDRGDGNQITSLDVSMLTALTDLRCSQNRLSSLDLSNNTALEVLYCDDNQLTSLDVPKNTALRLLDCNGNKLTSLDVSKNIALEELLCQHNQLTSLDVSGCTALTVFSCEHNQLASLDVSECAALEDLYCNYNQLTSLDVSECAALEVLYCLANQLTSLDVSECAALTSLWCDDNQLTSLDVSKCTALEYLWCLDNQLSSLDISECVALVNLQCYDNKLSSLDVSKNTALYYLACWYNPGDGASTFPVKAWFDNSSIPTGTTPSGDTYYFTTGSWHSGGKTITLYYYTE